MSVSEGGHAGDDLRSLSERLETLAPSLDRGQLAAASSRAYAGLAELAREARTAAGTRTVEIAGSEVSALIPFATASDLVVLVPDLAAALYRREATIATQEAVLDALVTNRLAPGAGTRERLSGALRGAIAQNARTSARPPVLQRLRREPERADEAALLAAARDGDVERVAAILVAASGLPLRAIRRAAEQKSVKALVSLTWKSGFTMRAGVAVQAALAELPASRLLQPSPAGGYPLSRDEMEWQIELVLGRCLP